MFTGQAKEFPSLCGQLCGDGRRSSLTLFCLWLFLQLILHCAATGWPTRGQGGGWRSSSNTCLTLHGCRHPSVRPRFLPSLGPSLHRSLRHPRCHHVRLFPPGLSQLARCLLWDEWVSFSLRSLLFFPPLVFPPYDFARSPQSNSPIEQQGSVVQWERFCLRACVWWREALSECKAVGADAELCCWPAVSAGCVCRAQGSVWRCHHREDVRQLCVSLLLCLKRSLKDKQTWYFYCGSSANQG